MGNIEILINICIEFLPSSLGGTDHQASFDDRVIHHFFRKRSGNVHRCFSIGCPLNDLIVQWHTQHEFTCMQRCQRLYKYKSEYHGEQKGDAAVAALFCRSQKKEIAEIPHRPRLWQAYDHDFNHSQSIPIFGSDSSERHSRHAMRKSFYK